MRKFAVGCVIKDRWDLTQSTFNGLFYSDQDKSTYDLYLIDNGSSEETSLKIKQYVKSALLPIKNLIVTPEVSVSKAWNLFLALTKDYEYRVKFDNDIVLHNTIVPRSEKAFTVKQNAMLPNEVDPLAGSPRSFSVIKGIGSAHKAKAKRDMIKQNMNHSSFLEHMYDFSFENNADLVALVPVSPNETFGKMYDAVLKVRRGGVPYLFGSCMMITKKAFETLGYFDERLPRRIDIEYSQRAIRNNLNIGYHPFYGVAHIGAGKSTESRDKIEQKYQQANMIEINEPRIETKADSQWEKVIAPIQKQCAKNKVLCLT